MIPIITKISIMKLGLFLARRTFLSSYSPELQTNLNIEFPSNLK